MGTKTNNLTQDKSFTFLSGGEQTTVAGTFHSGGEQTTVAGTFHSGGEQTTVSGTFHSGGEQTTVAGTFHSGGEQTTVPGTFHSGGEQVALVSNFNSTLRIDCGLSNEDPVGHILNRYGHSALLDFSSCPLRETAKKTYLIG